MVKTNRLGTLAAVVGLLSAAGLLVLMVVVEARPAEATFPGKNGKIAYVSNTGPRDFGEIYTINATGGKPYQITHNKMGDWEPSYSPDGKKIASAARAGRKTDDEIYTINAGGEVGYRSPTIVRTTADLPGEVARSDSSWCPHGMK